MKNHIPEQVTGKSLDCSKSLTLSSQEEATRFFERVRSKLLTVNRWNEITNAPSATFTIVDASGSPLDRTVQKGDTIRIDIPGPGLPSAGGYDWVSVEDITEAVDKEATRILLTLRPCPDPTQANTDTAHFFTQLATSSFLIEQKGRVISVHYAGRNEIINTKNASTLDNLRNFLVGVGAKMGASFPQWKALVEGLADADNH